MAIKGFFKAFIFCSLLILSSLLVSLVLAEVAVRLLIPIQGLTRIPKKYLGPRKIGFVPFSQWVITDPEYNESIKISNLGYRDDEIDPTRETIIFLGDSQTFGTGVNQGERFSDHIRQYVNKNCANVNILNVSMPGASTYDERRFLDDIIKKGVKVKHVFLNVVTNDHVANEHDQGDSEESDDDNNLAQKRQSSLSRWLKKHRYDSHLLRLTIERLSRYNWFLAFYSTIKLDLGLGEFRSLREIYINEEKSRMRLTYTGQAIEKIQKIAPVSVVLIPDRYRYDPTILKVADKELQEAIAPGEKLDFDRESRLVRAIADDLEILMIDPVDSFRSANNASALSFPLNGHLTAIGHELLAKVIIRNNQAKKFLCPGN